MTLRGVLSRVKSAVDKHLVEEAKLKLLEAADLNLRYLSVEVFRIHLYRLGKLFDER